MAHLSIHDTLDLDSDGFATLLPGGSSPLSLLSPNGGGIKARSPCATKPAPTAAPPPAALPSVGEEEEENEPLGALPQLHRGGRRPGGVGRRPDPRRQSLAISQLFAGLSEGAGLLGESELAVGDEDIQVPLARSGRLLGGAANHSSLFCDPDTGDLLDTELPSPLLPGGGAAPAGVVGQADAAMPAFCDSPVGAQVPRGTASVRRTPGAGGWAAGRRSGCLCMRRLQRIGLPPSAAVSPPRYLAPAASSPCCPGTWRCNPHEWPPSLCSHARKHCGV